MEKEKMMKGIKDRVKERAIWFALMYKSFSKLLPPDEVERCAREAIRQFGYIKAKKNKGNISPEEWFEKHVAKGSGKIFRSEFFKKRDHFEQRMTFCPLIEAWKEIGCSAEEIDLFCDIAMEADRARAEYHGIQCEIPKRMGKGDYFCQLNLKKM